MDICVAEQANEVSTEEHLGTHAVLTSGREIIHFVVVHSSRLIYIILYHKPQRESAFA